MDRLYTYYILVLRDFLSRIFGDHYPREIIQMMIMIDYGCIEIDCQSDNTIVYDRKRGKIHIIGSYELCGQTIMNSDIKSIKVISAEWLVYVLMKSGKCYLLPGNRSIPSGNGYG